MINSYEDTKEHSISPAYISYMTFITLLDWLKDMKVIPKQLDRSLWSDKFSGSTGIQLMSSLRFLKLLDGNIPQQRLVELVKADKDKRQSLMREILHEAYGHDIVDELETMTPKILDDKFKSLGTSEFTHRKAISFFVNAARSNGISLPTSISKKARNRGSRQRSQKLSGQVMKGQSNGDDQGKRPQDKSAGGEHQFLLHSALTALLKDLEESGPKWTKSERDRWFKTFETNLDYAYPPQKETTEA